MKNLAFIDGQNLHLGTNENGWRVNFRKLRIYLGENYGTNEAYYFIGYFCKDEEDLYRNLRSAGFIVIFKEHDENLMAKKKGNVDTDVVFEAMKSLIEEKNLSNIVLISGDGDYKKLVDYLIKKGKFKKILFPNKKASSLYKTLGSEYFDYLVNIRSYIEYKKWTNEKGS